MMDGRRYIDYGSDNKYGHRFTLEFPLDSKDWPRTGAPIVKQWCVEQFGEEGKGERWKFLTYSVYIRNEIDAFNFKMRWG